MKVEILSRKLITPSSPTLTRLQNMKISSFDQLSPSMYVSCIFYYPAAKDGVNNVQRSEQLQKSLSETLTLFYPLAGRCVKDKFLIDCNDKGAEYLEAQVSDCADLSQLLRDEELETGLQNHLVPNPFHQPDNHPLVVVQFNMFECGGVAVGVCVSHRISDAYTFFTFINSLGVACRIGIDKVHCPSFQLPSFCPPRDVSAIKTLDLRRNGDANNNVMKRFVFDGETILNLKAIADTRTKPTRVEVVTALIWRSFIQVSRVRHGGLRPSLMIISVNMRGRTTLPIPENSCGNFVGVTVAQFRPNNDSKVQLFDLVGQLHDAVRSRVTKYANASNGDELFFLKANALREMNEALSKSEIDVYIFTSWCHFGMYEADFGWGRPSWMNIPAVQGENLGWLMDAKDGNGIEAWLASDENSMLLFEQELKHCLTHMSTTYAN